MSDVLQLLIKGGPVTWIIGVMALMATWLIVLKSLHLHRAQMGEMDTRDFLRGVINLLKRGNAHEAISICNDTPGPVAHLVGAAISRCEGDRDEMMLAVEEACLSEIPRLQRNLKPLLAIANLAPLMGLLGTVVGMITLFQKIADAGTFVGIDAMAVGIWQALLSTAMGLCVAVPTYGFYQYFLSKIDRILLDMEKASSEIIYYLDEHQVKLENADARNDGDGTDTPLPEAGSEVNA